MQVKNERFCWTDPRYEMYWGGEVFLTGIHFPVWLTELTHKSQHGLTGELEEAAYAYTNTQKRSQNYSSEFRITLKKFYLLHASTSSLWKGI